MTTAAQPMTESPVVEIIKTAYKNLDGAEDAEKIIAEMERTVAAYRSVDESGVAYTTKTSAQWGEDERVQRDQDVGKTIMTGIRFLDEIMDGVSPNDLVVIAANTGVGKSQLLAEIARYASNGGHPTFLMALEAYAGEMQRRLKWPIICRLLRETDPCGPELDWVKFSHSRYQDILRPYEEQAQQEFAEKYGSLNTLYRNSATFSIEEMERAIVRASKDNTLTLLDHLHYVDTDSDDRNVNEYGMQKKIVQKLREIALTNGKPIVAAAHFSKIEPGKYAPILPPMEKIMGSSDISKIATHVVILGATSHLEPEAFPLPNVPGMGGTTPTLFRMAKSRTAGAERTHYVAACYYDRRQGQYRPQYVLGRLRGYSTKWAPVYEDELPGWAASAVRLQRPSP